MLEIHGKQECPFAWRVRLTAREKGIAFEWIPHDARSPDPRASQHNPQQRSPLLWDEGFPLVESLVIVSRTTRKGGRRDSGALAARVRVLGAGEGAGLAARDPAPPARLRRLNRRAGGGR